MNRDQLVDRIATIGESYAPMVRGDAEDMAYAILDDVLPQVSTVEELEALPHWSWLIQNGAEWPYRWNAKLGTLRDFYDCDPNEVLAKGPLTVVWQPCT